MRLKGMKEKEKKKGEQMINDLNSDLNRRIDGKIDGNIDRHACKNIDALSKYRLDNLRRNKSGYIDNTAFKAISNVHIEESNDDIYINNFIKDIYRICDRYEIDISGSINLKLAAYIRYKGQKQKNIFE